MTERLALDTYNWRGRTNHQIKSDLASYLIENRNAPLEKRTTYYELNVNNSGQLVSDEFGRVIDLINVRSLQDKKELEATIELEEWAGTKSEKNVALWISPPSGSYSESRFVIFEKNEDKIKCRAICGKESAEECINIANKLGEIDFTDSESLRGSIIKISEELSHDWISSFEKVFGHSEVWDRIRNGKDIDEKKITTFIAEQIATKYAREIRLAENYYRQILLGAIIEEEARFQGYQINMSGSCGISNLAALSMVSDTSPSPFNSFFMGNWGIDRYFSCPRCMGKIPSGFGITTCPHCGAKKEHYGKCV
jgi:hypothetical protein